jgi:hypothetical protein
MANGEDRADLEWALEMSRYEDATDPPPLLSQVRASGIAGFWYAESKAHKRAATAGEKQKWQRIEDILENAVTVLNRGVIATQHLNKFTEAIRG